MTGEYSKGFSEGVRSATIIHNLSDAEERVRKAVFMITASLGAVVVAAIFQAWAVAGTWGVVGAIWSFLGRVAIRDRRAAREAWRSLQ